MDIKEKMNLCFNENLESNEVLTVNEKKVLAALMYSYKVCKMSKDGEVIRSMTELRKDVKMNINKLYDALRNLENLYGMIERAPGKTRKAGEKSTASLFKLHFDKILNPPKEKKKFDFTEELKSPEKPINKANTDTNTKTDTETKVEKKDKLNTTGAYNEKVTDKFKLLEKFINNNFDKCKTYQEAVSQISSIYDWIHEKYSDSSNVEPLTDYANELINKKLSIYSSPVNVVTTETVKV